MLQDPASEGHMKTTPSGLNCQYNEVVYLTNQVSAYSNTTGGQNQKE